MTIEKLDMSTPNITDDNVARIAELFPNVVTEGRDENGKLTHVVDFDALKQELSDSIVEGPQERYRLDWPGKREAMLAANTPITKTLRPVREESVDFDTTQNLFIEGDNLDALKLLQETYLGKVKMIYIDPPYNTGKDFIYKDNFTGDKQEYLEDSGQVDEEGGRLVANPESGGRYHSDWLTMMYPRLKLARNLLRDDGVVFISIDDNEASNLTKLCDTLFGSSSFVGKFPWRSRTAKADVPFGVSKDVEWIIAYANSKFFAGREGTRKYHSSEDFADEWRLQDLTTNKDKNERPNSFFSLVNPKDGKSYEANPKRTWAVTKDTFQSYYDAGNIVFPGDYDFLSIKKPAFRVFKATDEQKSLQKYGTKNVRMSVSTYLPEGDVKRNEHGTKRITALFEEPVFSYPKPIELINFFINSVDDKDGIYLDFFAGSATTADSLLTRNLIDGGKRQYILVQLPEKLDPTKSNQKTGAEYCARLGIALKLSELSKERIRRAGKKILEENPERVGKLDVGFRVLKIDSSNMKDVYYAPGELTQGSLLDAVEHIKPDRTAEDLLFQVMLDWGVDLSLPIAREEIDGKIIYWVGDNDLAACFDLKISEDIVKAMAGRKPLRAVFRDDGFGSDDMKINAGQLFAQMTDGHTDMKVV